MQALKNKTAIEDQMVGIYGVNLLTGGNHLTAMQATIKALFPIIRGQVLDEVIQNLRDSGEPQALNVIQDMKAAEGETCS